MKLLEIAQGNWRRALLLLTSVLAGIGILLMWEILGMYTDSQAIATGDSTLIYAMISWAFGLAAITFVMSGTNSTRSQITASNPVILFLVGGFLMLWNIMVPQYHSIPEATASATIHQWFYVELGIGAIGLFVFLCGFQVIIMNIVRSKLYAERGPASTIPRDQLPYRYLFQVIFEKIHY